MLKKYSIKNRMRMRQAGTDNKYNQWIEHLRRGEGTMSLRGNWRKKGVIHTGSFGERLSGNNNDENKVKKKHTQGAKGNIKVKL